MISVNSLYKFYFDHPTEGSVQFFPLNNKLSWEFENEKDNFFFRKKLNTVLKIEGDHFKMLHALERSKYRCDKIPIRIELKVGETFEPYFTGYLALIDADEWNIDFCYVKIKPRIEDEYSCLLAKWNLEKDFIGGAGAPSVIEPVKLAAGKIEYKTCEKKIYGSYTQREGNQDYLPPITECLSFVDTWTVVSRSSESLGFENNQRVAMQRDTFAREVYDGFLSDPPTGAGWTLVWYSPPRAAWARPLAKGLDDIALLEPFKNGYKFSDVLQYLVDDCELKIKSNFFGINSIDGLLLNNQAYTAAKKHYRNLVIFQKSDVRRNSTKDKVYEPATKAVIKLRDLLDWLRVIFNVFWIIDDGFLVIEHLTYFKQNKQNMINLTHENFEKFITGKYNYKYTNQDLPISEKWAWMEQSKYPHDFDGKPIEYMPECSFDDYSSNDKNYQVSKITTNILYIVKEKDEISDDGFVLLATDDFKNIQTATGELTGTVLINGAMSLANLLYNCHRDGRPQRTGKMNGKDEQFFNIKRTREQKEISIQIPEGDMLIFDPLHRVKTQLGWGEIAKATIEAPIHKLKVQLLHE